MVTSDDPAWKTVTNELIAAQPDDQIVTFFVAFTDKASEKLTGSRQVTITYQTAIDRTNLTEEQAGQKVTINNWIPLSNGSISASVDTSFYEKLQKQASPTGLPEGAITEDSFNSYTDDLVKVERGDSGGVLHYRIRLYDYTEGETVTDTLPEGATFLEDSVRLFTHSTTDVQLRNEMLRII